ncbi:MAG TPA: 50S ribosomal protein L18 [Gemmatales bacterium]|nr:50S ribosomal protein L18 [Gemmatales bacterium]
MDRQILKRVRQRRRKAHVRKKVRGTAARPRLTVHRSNLHMYAQIVDDDAGVTLVAAGTLGKKSGLAYGGNIKAAQEVGKQIAAAAQAKGITQVCFDRGHYLYHGRVKALADAAREAGLKF